MDQLILTFIHDPRTIIAAFLIALDTLAGIGAAFKQKTFTVAGLPDFLSSSVLPYIVGYFAWYLVVVAGIPGMIAPYVGGDATAQAIGQGLASAASLFSWGGLAMSIKANVDELTAGMVPARPPAPPAA